MVISCTVGTARREWCSTRCRRFTRDLLTRHPRSSRRHSLFSACDRRAILGRPTGKAERRKPPSRSGVAEILSGTGVPQEAARRHGAGQTPGHGRVLEPEYQAVPWDGELADRPCSEATSGERGSRRERSADDELDVVLASPFLPRRGTEHVGVASIFTSFPDARMLFGTAISCDELESQL